MNDKLQFGEVYQQLKNNKVYEEIYSFDDKGNGGLRWGEKFVVTSFKFIVRISVATKRILTTFLHMQKYYVEMTKSLTATNFF